jgi:hypothetical protein
MSMFEFSIEHQKFRRTNRCPRCQKGIMWLTFIKPDGTSMSAWSTKLNKRAICRHCGYSWSVFSAAQYPAAEYDEPTAAPSRLSLAEEIIVMEGKRIEVPLGNESRTIDNLDSSSSSIRTVRLTREWARTWAVDMERTTTVRGAAGLGVHLLSLKADAERTLRNTYSITTDEKQTFTEEVTLNIADHKMVKIIFFWKQIRQIGAVQLIGKKFDVRIPYEVVVGLTFDQRQIDIP